jgi:hypothetical protein
VRTITGAPVVADSSTLIDATFAEARHATLGGAINCDKLATIWIGVEFVAPGATSVDLDLLVRDADAADGARWRRFGFGSTNALFQPTFSGTTTVGSPLLEMRVDGCLVYPRIFNVVGSPTSVILLARPGAPIGAGKGLFPG